MLKIITTHDGSHSLLNEELNETYHSVHGALQESSHVFIKNGLDFLFHSSPKKSIKILEIGFGTGLNAWLTHQYCVNKDVSIEYTALEAFPIEESIWRQLNYTQSLEDQEIFSILHQAAWDEWVEISRTFMLRKLNKTLQLSSLDHDYYDLVYFDAFAPNKQPEMWDLPMLQKTIQSLKHDGVFVTYCAKGQLKRDLSTLRLEVESLQGPPGKREMVRGTRKFAS